MVKITFSPVNELVIHEALEISLEDLLRERVTPAGNMPIYWCDGIGFTFNSAPMSEEIIKDYLKGIIHWVEVHYSRMDQYTSLIELTDPNQGSMKIRVLNTTQSELHREFIKWLKLKAQKTAAQNIIQQSNRNQITQGQKKKPKR